MYVVCCMLRSVPWTCALSLWPGLYTSLFKEPCRVPMGRAIVIRIKLGYWLNVDPRFYSDLNLSEVFCSKFQIVVLSLLSSLAGNTWCGKISESATHPQMRLTELTPPRSWIIHIGSMWKVNTILRAALTRASNYFTCSMGIGNPRRLCIIARLAAAWTMKTPSARVGQQSERQCSPSGLGRQLWTNGHSASR